MRIIGGYLKGKSIMPPAGYAARPTTDYAKEGLFNTLINELDFESVSMLDLFSGTGSISLELVSRGCSHVISVEQDRDHHRFITDCLKKLDTNVCLPLRGDAFRFIKSCRQQFDFIFADPPYALKELPTIPTLIFERGLLKDGGVFVFEHGRDNDFSQDAHFVEHRTYGSVNFSIFKQTEQL